MHAQQNIKIAVTLFGKHLNFMTTRFQIRVICTMSDPFAFRNFFIFVGRGSKVRTICIHESVVTDNSQKIQASCNVKPYRVVIFIDVWTCGVVFVVRLKQLLFGLLDIYLRMHFRKRPLGRSRRM